MNAPVPSRVFKNGNSVAVRLPKVFGFSPGQDVLVEEKDGGVLVRRKVDTEDERRRWLAFLEHMRRLPRPGSIEIRDTGEIPERPGL